MLPLVGSLSVLLVLRFTSGSLPQWIVLAAGFSLAYLVFFLAALAVGLDDHDRIIARALWSRVRGVFRSRGDYLMASDLRELRLPAELCTDAERRFAERFGNLEQLLTFLLRELLRDEAAQMDQAEQRVVEQRLRDLGYI